MVLFGTRFPDFTIQHSTPPGGTLLCGFTSVGLAGLTAVDFLVDELELEQIGYLTVEGLPSITPFEDGRPTHHTRLFSRPDLDVTVLKSELFVPARLGRAFGDAILDWTERNGVDEVAVLSGVPLQHGPEEHLTYFIASDDYREKHLRDADVPPMGRGFMDGVNGALIERGIESPLGVAVFVTPVHEQSPDLEAAVRLVETIDGVYDLGVDTSPLKAFAKEVAKYYADLAERLAEEERKDETAEDRMYM